jgi:hypothetical protein
MATFSITSTQRISELTGKQNADAYNINGGTLVVDCDSRFSQNPGVLGNLTISSTLGGRFWVDATKVRLIPFTGGAGAVPAAGAAVTQGGATAELLCVMSERTGGTVHTGQMPATGWLKVRTVGAFGPGALSGLTATATAADEAGWIVVVGAEDRTFNIPRLGSVVMDGDWFAVGTTTGARGQTMALPHFSADSMVYYPGVEIETAPGSGVYNFWPNVGAKFRSDTVSTDSRSRYVHISTNGVMTIGRGTNNSDAGDLPALGCKVRIPNIILQNTGSNRAHNTCPDGMGARYESIFTGGGTLVANKVTGAWFWNITQAWTATIDRLHTCDQFALSRTLKALTIGKLGVGMSTRSSFFDSTAILIQQLQDTVSVSIDELVAVRAEGKSNTGYAVTLQNLCPSTRINKVRATYASDCTAISAGLFLNACDDLTIARAEVVGKRTLVYGCKRSTIEVLVYADNVRAATTSTLPTHAVEAMNQSIDCAVLTIEPWDGAPNTYPYNGLVYVGGTERLTVRGVGTPQNPYNGGGLMGTLLSDGGNNVAPKFQRCWLTGLRMGLNLANTGTTGLLMENCYHEDAAKTQLVGQVCSTSRGNRHNGASIPTTYPGVVGTSWMDHFTGDSTSRAVLVMNEPLISDGNFAIEAGAPRFTGQGGLVMQAGDVAVWTTPYAILGWTSMSSFSAAGGNVGLHSLSYDIDKGQGFAGTFKALNSLNLTAETGISPTNGFRLRIRVECTASNFSNVIHHVAVTGNTSRALQHAALYPLDAPTATLHLSGLLFGSAVAVALDGVQVFTGTTVTPTMQITYPHQQSASVCRVTVTKTGHHTEVLEVPYAQVLSVPVCQNELGQPVTPSGPATGATLDIAAAVQAILLDDFAAIDARLANQMHDAYDPNQQYYVITRNGSQFVGATKDNPYEFELPENFSIAEFTGAIPDLNFNAWDYNMDQFKSSLPTRVAFFERFTVAEMVAMRASTAPVVQDILERWDSKRYINVQDALTLDSLTYLETAGLLAAGRAAEIAGA